MEIDSRRDLDPRSSARVSRATEIRWRDAMESIRDLIAIATRIRIVT